MAATDHTKAEEEPLLETAYSEQLPHDPSEDSEEPLLNSKQKFHHPLEAKDILKTQCKSESNLAQPLISHDRESRNNRMDSNPLQKISKIQSHKSDSNLVCKTKTTDAEVHPPAPYSGELDNKVSHYKKNVNLLLVGCKGNGKSHTGNTILGQEAFRVTRKGGTETSSLCSSSHDVDGVSRKVTVVDTPGVSQEMTESEFEELVRAVKMVPEGFDAICLVWDYENSEKNEDKEVQVFQSLHRLFGDKLYKHLVILVTHAQQEDIPEFLDELPEAMKEITKQCHATEFCEDLKGSQKQITGNNPNSYRVIAINKRLSTNESEQDEVHRLFNMVQKLSTTSAKYKASDLSPDCQMPQWEDHAELNLLLVGKTGVGKSQTGNSIVGTQTFTVSDTAVSKTENCEHSKIQVGSLTLNIIDTPGIDVSHKKSQKHIMEWFKENPSNVQFDATLLVSKRENYGADDEKMVSILTGTLGERFLDNAIMVITGKDQLTKSEEDYIKDAPLKFKETLEKCNDRYVFFDNTTKDETLRQKQLVKLIRLIHKAKHDNPPSLSTENTIELTVTKKRSNWFGRVWKRLRSCCCCCTTKRKSLNHPQS